MNKLITALLLSASLMAAPAQAQSHASEASAFSTFIVVAGTVSALVSAGDAVVESVEKVGDVTVVVLKSAAGASGTTLRLSGDVAQGFSLAAGTAVSITATASGHLLVAAGKVLAFIPNEAGKALLHSSKHSEVKK